jgi:hypothetical protein
MLLGLRFAVEGSAIKFPVSGSRHPIFGFPLRARREPIISADYLNLPHSAQKNGREPSQDVHHVCVP